MATANTPNSDQLTLALPTVLKEQLENAAESLDMPVNEYALFILAQETSKNLYGPPILKLSARDSQRMIEALENPDPPLNSNLLEAINEYRKRNVGDV